MVNRAHRLLIVLTGLGLAAGLLLVGCRGKAPPGPELRIEEHTVIYRGTRLEPGMALGQWKRALGEPSRHVDRDCGIYIWDDLGLAVSLLRRFPASDPHVALLRVFFVPRNVDFWPRKPFAGTVRATFVEHDGGVNRDNHRTVTATFRAGTTYSEVADRQDVRPSLSRYIHVRFLGQPSDRGPIEILSVGIEPGMYHLPWEVPDGGAGMP
jgi:hypothetical protein